MDSREGGAGLSALAIIAKGFYFLLEPLVSLTHYELLNSDSNFEICKALLNRYRITKSSNRTSVIGHPHDCALTT